MRRAETILLTLLLLGSSSAGSSPWLLEPGEMRFSATAFWSTAAERFAERPGPPNYPYAMRDLETESVWTVEGLAIEGPLAGAQLERVRQVIAYWFAWAAFHPDTEIYGS